MIKCDQRAKAKCPFKKPCCGDEAAYFVEGSECDKFNQKVLSQRPTNADRIRAMSDEELAAFVAEKIVNLENQKMMEQGHTPTATQLSALGHTMYCTLMRWLCEPAEGE